MQNIRDKEIQFLGKVLTLNPTGGTNAMLDFTEQWKILIYDQDGRDIISPLLNVGALRQKGVTLHLMLHSEREAISDAPAVYFIKPTEANIKRIAEDCAKPLYRSVYINFITKIDRPLLEKFAQELIAQNATNNIIKIYDQYLDVIALEPNLFSLNIKDSFAGFNEPSLNETQIRSFMNRVALGVLSTVRVLGALPIIRAAPGGAAEMLAHEVNNILKENISARGPAQALFEDCLVHDRSRPLMVILDRSSDIFPVLQHNSTYQALINELLDFKLNRVTVEVTEKGSLSNTKKKTYDLNTQTDQFLSRYASAPFPEAVDANEKELAEVSQREAAIRSRPDFAKMANSLTSGESNNPDLLSAVTSASASLEGKGKDLSEAIESLPEILLKKANLETHTNIMQALMKKIASREIPTYFELEQSILVAGGKSIDRAAVIGLLKDGSKGNLYDKGRLLAIATALSDPSTLNKTINEEYDQALLQGCQGITMNPPSTEEIHKVLGVIAFLRRLVTLQSSPMLRGGGFGGGSGSSASNAILSSFLTTAQSRATSLIAQAASFFTKFTPYHITRIVHNLADGRGGSEDESFVYLDPKHPSASPSAGQKYSEVIVFVLGGGCYSEYYNLQESLKEKASSSAGYPRHILYGCTELLSGDEFLKQIENMLPPPASTTISTPAK